MTRISSALALVLGMLSVAHGVATGQTGQDLAQLTVPANQLPAGCRLISRTGAFIPTNVIFSWADLMPSKSDQGCLDVVRRHIDRVQLK